MKNAGDEYVYVLKIYKKPGEKGKIVFLESVRIADLPRVHARESFLGRRGIKIREGVFERVRCDMEIWADEEFARMRRDRLVRVSEVEEYE